MAKAKPPKASKLFSPVWLSLAAMTSWAATHEPGSFANPGLVGAWGLGALAVALLTRAGLALLGPLLKLTGQGLRLLIADARGPDQGGADP
ncbi:hypothetical protein [Acidocella facilis]|uniref:hypothetical protein n=1 Tax=Acidocella facilis TaxID=525 RepID=UPI00047B668A|nr:hypothetical protein [Acidocella facilis]